MNKQTALIFNLLLLQACSGKSNFSTQASKQSAKEEPTPEMKEPTSEEAKQKKPESPEVEEKKIVVATSVDQEPIAVEQTPVPIVETSQPTEVPTAQPTPFSTPEPITSRRCTPYSGTCNTSSKNADGTFNFIDHHLWWCRADGTGYEIALTNNWNCGGADQTLCKANMLGCQPITPGQPKDWVICDASQNRWNVLEVAPAKCAGDYTSNQVN